jgi:hypothetical protein
MPPKSPEQSLQDATVRHQVHLTRLAVGQRNRAAADIIKALNEAADQIERLDLGAVRTRAQLDARIESILARLDKAVDRANGRLEANLRDVADEEAGFLSRLWERTIGGG